MGGKLDRGITSWLQHPPDLSLAASLLLAPTSGAGEGFAYHTDWLPHGLN